MRCIFAVLYLRGLDSMMSNRLVVMSADDYASYGVYGPPGDKFPTPGPNTGIILTKNNPREPGTYNALYCSETLDTKSIVTTITAGLTPLTPDTLCPPDPNDPQAISCNKHIADLVNQHIPIKLFSLSHVLEDHKCTLSQIITFVQKGLIMPTGSYNFDMPSNHNPLFYLATERKVKVSEILMSREVFRTKRGKYWHILAWSQGHLHLFHEDGNPKHWTKITKFGSEKENAAKIVEFLITFNLTNHYLKMTPEGENVHVSGKRLNKLQVHYSHFKNRIGAKYDSRMLKKFSPDRLISNTISETSQVEFNEPHSAEKSIANSHISDLVNEAVKEHQRPSRS
ncbi:CSEP0308 putative effector protein [Blumeria hordei DH14]|uniref:CSEP0308 putative effector protein n=1 Tax=Blumeria graminis f. sp. hordei (strain DH14) TaxID=546991 RepID=N1JAH5_BLUG1|nr:CSEP0308 putative effector protein [Blumeria hordei DH14]